MSNDALAKTEEIIGNQNYQNRLEKSVFSAKERVIFTECVRHALRRLKNIELMAPDSLRGAIHRALHDGLMPDGREALFASRYDARSGRHYADYHQMVGGVLKILYRSPKIKAVDAFAVYEKDEFVTTFGDRPSIRHIPILSGQGTEYEDRGRVVSAYAIIRLQNGGLIREVLSTWDIARIRAAAKTDVVWATWTDQMAIKAAIKRVAKRAPIEADLQAMLTEEHAGEDEPELMQTSIEQPPKQTRLEQKVLSHQPTGFEQPFGGSDVDFGRELVAQIGRPE